MPEPQPGLVLMTADTVGGVWTYAMELCAALGRQGVRVALATMGALPTEAQRREARAIRTLTLWPSDLRLEWMADPWDDVARAGDWLLELAERLRPDVVHLNGYAHGALRFPAPVLVVGHSCVLSWWRAVHGEDAPDRYAAYRRAVAAGLRAAGLVAAPTRDMLAALGRHYGPLGDTRVIPNGRALSLEAALSGDDTREPFIFAAGRVWDEAKNIAALGRVARRLPWPVYVAGAAEPPAGPLAERRVPAGVRALGPLPQTEVWRWLSRASIYALPARYEPFGLSALEAALCGCALVLGDIPSLREVWGDAAAFVPPGDDEALRATLEELIHGPERRAELGAAARRRALRYGPAAMAEAYLGAYRHLLTPARHACAS